MIGDDRMEEQLIEILEYYKNETNSKEQETLVEMLREIQELLGCIPTDIQNRIAKEFGIKETMIATLIKLYPSLKAANFKHRIVACTGARCMSKEGGQIYEALKKELEVGSDGLSKDGTVYVTTQNCLKRCKMGPNIYIDGEMYSQLTISDAKDLVQKLKNK